MKTTLTITAFFIHALQAGAMTTPATLDDELSAEVRRLEAQIAALEEAERRDEIESGRAEAIRALVEDVLADADQRVNLIGQGLLAGHDGGFFIADSDDHFRLEIGGQFHVRFVSNWQQSSPDDNYRSGFELRRTQLKFLGYVINPRLTYKVQGGVDRSSGDLRLLDAEIGWMIAEGWFVRAGQFRPGFLREDSTSSTRQIAVERSLVNGRFAQNRMQGIELRGLLMERFRASGMVSDGLRSRNTPWERRTVEYALTGRAEWLVAGEWRQFRQFTSPPGESPGLMLGGAIHWQRDAFGTPHDGELEVLRWTVDGQLSLGGASAFAAFIASHESIHGGADHLRWGLVVQGAVYLTDSWELFTRYEHGDADAPGAGRGRLSVITAGVNWYIDGQRVKWTTDLGVGLRAVDQNWSTSSAGWRTDAAGKSGQIVLRSQLQLLF